jgi:hypothetical protein
VNVFVVNAGLVVPGERIVSVEFRVADGKGPCLGEAARRPFPRGLFHGGGGGSGLKEKGKLEGGNDADAAPWNDDVAPAGAWGVGRACGRRSHGVHEALA